MGGGTGQQRQPVTVSVCMRMRMCVCKRMCIFCARSRYHFMITLSSLRCHVITTSTQRQPMSRIRRYISADESEVSWLPEGEVYMSFRSELVA